MESSGAYGEGRTPAAAETVVGDGGASGLMLLNDTECFSGEAGRDVLDPMCTEARFPKEEDISISECFRGRRFRGEDEAFGVTLSLAVGKVEPELNGCARLGGRVGDLSRET